MAEFESTSAALTVCRRIEDWIAALPAPDESWTTAFARSKADAAACAKRLKALAGSKKAKAVAEREALARDEAARDGAASASAVPVVPAVVKVETDGELAAVLELLAALPSHEVRLELVHAAVGPIGRADVERLAAAAADDACAAQPRVFAFNVGVAGGDVSSAAKRAKVDVRRHSVIYALIDDVRAALCDALPPRVVEESVGRAEVLQTFAIDGGATLVAGCRVVDGVLRAKAGVRVVRAGRGGRADGDDVVHDAPRGADSLQHLKDRVAEVSKGMECGIALDGFEGFEPGDILHCYVQREERRTSLDQPI